MSSYKEYLNSRLKDDSSAASQVSFQMWIKSLGLRITSLREILGYKQQDLAEKMGVAQSVIARIEAGHNMTCLTLWKLGDALNLELNIFGVSSFNIKNQLSSYIKGKENVTLYTAKNIPKKEIKQKVSSKSVLSHNYFITSSQNGKKSYDRATV